MQLTEEQTEQVRRWAADGATLGQIQTRLREDFGVSLSYMETRFLVSDLDVRLAEKAEPATAGGADTLVSSSLAKNAAGGGLPAGKVTVTLDELTPAYAVISGKVTFSDGVCADWHFDELGRLALNPAQQGYRPKESDLLEFQKELRQLVQSRGL